MLCSGGIFWFWPYLSTVLLVFCLPGFALCFSFVVLVHCTCLEDDERHCIEFESQG